MFRELLWNSNYRRSLALADIANFVNIYGHIDLATPGQLKLAEWITKYPTGQPEGDVRQAIAKVNRGGGKTITVGTAFAYLHASDRTWKIFVHSGSYEQARYCYEYYEPYTKIPELFPPDCFVGKPTRSLTKFKEGGFLRVLAASEKQSRGGHVDIVTLDEVVLIKQDLIDAALPTVHASHRPTIIVISTASPKISYRWFLNNWQNAEKQGFQRFEWPPTECRWINPKTTARLAKLFDKSTADVELRGQIAEYRGFVFDGKSIDACVVDPFNEDTWPLPSAAPLTNWHGAADWGFTHPTVIGDLEVRSDVAFLRDIHIREQEPIGTILDEIRTDFKDEPFYAGNDGASEIAQLQADGLEVYPVAFSKDKALLIGELKRRLERGLFRLPDPKRLAEGDETHDAEPLKAQEFQRLIDELHEYHYDDNGKPVKVDDDCVDMVLYLMKSFIENRPQFNPVSRAINR